MSGRLRAQMVVRDALTVRRRHKLYETRGARRLAKKRRSSRTQGTYLFFHSASFFIRNILAVLSTCIHGLIRLSDVAVFLGEGHHHHIMGIFPLTVPLSP